MQTGYLQKKLYQIRQIDETEYSEKAFDRERKLKIYENLMLEKCSQKVALEAISISKATLYRWRRRYKELGLAGLEDEDKRPSRLRKPAWGRKEERFVAKLRKRFPIWGKLKIKVLLERIYKLYLSVATVGRIIRRLVSKGIIKPVHFFMCCVKAKKERAFSSHAQRWRYGMKSNGPGQLVQVDHMTVKLPNGKQVKHFNAICPFTRISFGKAYCVATSALAKDFLNHIQAQFPFKITSIQVDGGSEFMGEFEAECEKEAIGLLVLPPRRPQYNGSVERVNGIFKHEFYQFYDGTLNLEQLNLAIKLFTKTYNQVRPHQALQLLTPLQNYQNLVASESHMY